MLDSVYQLNVTMEMMKKSKSCLIESTKNKMDDWISLSTMPSVE